MKAPRPHHHSAPVVDILPCDVAVEQCGGLVDVYIDTNEVTWRRVRLTSDLAISLYVQLAEKLPITMTPKDANHD